MTQSRRQGFTVSKQSQELPLVLWEENGRKGKKRGGQSRKYGITPRPGVPTMQVARGKELLFLSTCAEAASIQPHAARKILNKKKENKPFPAEKGLTVVARRPGAFAEDELGDGEHVPREGGEEGEGRLPGRVDEGEGVRVEEDALQACGKGGREGRKRRGGGEGRCGAKKSRVDGRQKALYPRSALPPSLPPSLPFSLPPFLPPSLPPLTPIAPRSAPPLPPPPPYRVVGGVCFCA
jgi:hypothetical protein